MTPTCRVSLVLVCAAALYSRASQNTIPCNHNHLCHNIILVIRFCSPIEFFSYHHQKHPSLVLVCAVALYSRTISTQTITKLRQTRRKSTALACSYPSSSLRRLESSKHPIGIVISTALLPIEFSSSLGKFEASYRHRHINCACPLLPIKFSLSLGKFEASYRHRHQCPTRLQRCHHLWHIFLVIQREC